MVAFFNVFLKEVPIFEHVMGLQSEVFDRIPYSLKFHFIEFYFRLVDKFHRLLILLRQ